MKILILGANSYVGARLYWELSQVHEVVGTYAHASISERLVQLDVTDKKAVDTLIADKQPDVIVHCANNADPRWCDAHPDEAIVLNQESTKFIVNAANVSRAKVIYISSFAALNPNAVYAKTKYESEKIVQQTKAGYLILRPSVILGFSPNTTNDRPFNRLLKNLDQKTEAIYDTSWKFQVTYIRHISEVIATCIDRNIWGYTISITVAGLKTRYDTARDILSSFGILVTPIDKHDTLPVTEDNLQTLSELALPQYTYEQMITAIIDEIKHRERYVL